MSKRASRWTPPAGFRAGDSLPIDQFTIGKWGPRKIPEGTKRLPKKSPFIGRNLVELMLWMRREETYQDDLTMHPQQPAWLRDAVNAAMTRADPTFRNLHDEARPGAPFDGPGAGAAANVR